MSQVVLTGFGVLLCRVQASGLVGLHNAWPGSSELKLKVGKPLLALTPHKNFIV